MANKIEIDVVAKDLASAALDIVKDKLTQIGGKAGMVGVAALTMGAAIVTALGKAANMAQEYDQKVYDMMLTTRGTAEETSKLIQVVDDTGVSYETLKMAMKMAIKNGIEPNIESIATLADQYVSLKDPVKQGQLLLDSFGKSGMDMARTMELGGDALRKMANEMKGGLILTQENIEQSEIWRKNLDELQDGAEGYAIALGNKVVPAVNDLISSWRTINREKENAIAIDNELLDVTNSTWEQYQLLDKATRMQAEAQARLNISIRNGNSDAQAMMSTNSAYKASINGVTLSLEEQAVADKAVSDSNRNLLTLTKDIQRETDNYKYSLSELNIKQYELSQILTDLEAKGKTNTQMYRDTQAAMEANKEAVMQLSTEHEMAMKKIAVDLYVAKLQADGFTEAEYKMAIQAMVSAGIIDNATAEMALGMDAAMNSAINAKDAVVTLGGKAKEIATDYFMNFIATLTINAKRVDYGSEPPDVAVPPGAPDLPNGDMQATGTGGNFLTVPAGYPNDGYPVWMTSGEQYAVIPRNGNNTNNGGGAMGGMVVNLTYAPAFSTASQSEFVSSITPMLDAWYRKAKRS